MKALIDGRIREEEFTYLLEELKLDIILIEPSNSIYPEISGHSDIFYTKIDNQIYCSPNARYIETNFIIGKEPVKYSYPDDVKYNVCQIGKYVIGSKYADEKILDKINVFVKQGYTKCNIAVTGDNSCITSDVGIYKTLKDLGMDVLLLQTDNIGLINKDHLFSEMHGFIGGATAIVNDTFVLFGDVDYLSKENRRNLLEHIERHNLKFKDFKYLKIVDYGGLLIYA